MRLKRHGKTIVFVEHDMGFIGSIAERIVVIDQGVVIADGVPERIRSDERVISAYLGTGLASAKSKREKSVPSPARSEAPLLDIQDLTVKFGMSRCRARSATRPSQSKPPHVIDRIRTVRDSSRTSNAITPFPALGIARRPGVISSLLVPR